MYRIAAFSSNLYTCIHYILFWPSVCLCLISPSTCNLPFSYFARVSLQLLSCEFSALNIDLSSACQSSRSVLKSLRLRPRPQRAASHQSNTPTSPPFWGCSETSPSSSSSSLMVSPHPFPPSWLSHLFVLWVEFFEDMGKISRFKIVQHFFFILPFKA